MTDPNDPAEHAHVVDMHALHEATEAAKAAGVTDIQAVNEWDGAPATRPATPDLPDDVREAKAQLDAWAAEVRCDPPVPGPDTPTWTVGDDIIVWLSGDGAVRRSDVANDEAFAALVADVRAARHYGQLRESIAAEAEIVDDPEHHYSGPAVAQILRALLHEED